MQKRWPLLFLCGVALAGCGQSGGTVAKNDGPSGNEPAMSKPSTDLDAGSMTKPTDSNGKPQTLLNKTYVPESDTNPPASSTAKPTAEANGAPVNTAADADLMGSWKGEMKMPEAKGDDPAAAMATSMAKMMAGSLKLEFKPNHKFVLNMIVPIEGSYTRSGRTLSLKMETVMGMTPEEAAKASGKGLPGKNEPMKATISADGKTISVSDPKSPSATMTFHRGSGGSASGAAVKSTVSAAEGKLVGDYSGDAQIPKGAKLTEQQKQALEMMKKMKNAIGLELRADNTCTFKMVMEMTGKWKLSGNKVVLDIKDAMGMASAFGSGASSSTSKPIELEVNSNGSLRMIDDSPETGSLVFTKK